MPLLRALVFRQIHPNGWDLPGLSPYNRLLLVTVAVAILGQVFETEKGWYVAHQRLFALLDIVVGLVFTLDYLLRAWVSVELPAYPGWSGRLRYLLTATAVCDLLATTPFLLHYATDLIGSNDLALLRLLQVFKLMRAARLGRFGQAAAAVQEALRERSFELLLSLGAAAVMMLVTATLLYLVEGEVQPRAFGSVPRALWWSIETLTTVGYGDVAPVTPLGKVLAGLSAILGIGVIALPTGILAAAFSNAFQAQRHDHRHTNDQPPA